MSSIREERPYQETRARICMNKNVNRKCLLRAERERIKLHARAESAVIVMGLAIKAVLVARSQ